jgi:hypothetical protein
LTCRLNPPDQTPDTPQNSNTGSLVKELGLQSPEDLSLKGQDRVISVLAQKYDEMAKELHEIKQEKILKELPPELREHLGLPPSPPPRLKRGRGYRPLMAHEITEAKEKLLKIRPEVNMAMVARALGVSYPTVKKYAKMYGIWEPKPNIKGVKGIPDPERGKHPLSEILGGKHPEYSIFRIKDKLIRGGLKQAKCEMCGHKEKRITDGKQPLILNFMDGNCKNHALENMKLYCYNCTFIAGRGYLRSGSRTFDPDWLQGADKEIAEKRPRY